MGRRVVITGMGIWSTLGQTLDQVRDALYDGKCGIVLDAQRKELGFRSALTSFVPRPDLKGELSRQARTTMGEPSLYAYCATRDALRQAGVDPDYLEAHPAGLIYGNDSTADAVCRTHDTIRDLKSTSLCGSGAVFQCMNSSVTMNLSVLFHLRGLSLTVSAACASGSHAVGLASTLIRDGLLDMVVCGGAQEVNPNATGSFDGIEAFSLREDAPEKASRPFDRDRDGLVPGGGAASLVLESLESAQKRGARPLAEVLGYGFSADGQHISTPGVDGPFTAMSLALKRAGLSPADIGYINAHATSTVLGDANEARAIARLFGEKTVPVTSTKGQTGHEMWMAGASELIYSYLMMRDGFLAASLNFEHPDEESARLQIVQQTREGRFDTFLSNSFGFGGTNAALVVQKL